MKKYLKQAPTLVVIGVTGFAAWSVLASQATPDSPPGTSKPPEPDHSSDLVELDSIRNPFRTDRTPDVAASKGASTTGPGSAESKAGKLPELSADDDKVLAGMTLGGTFIDGQDQLAVINQKVYARGERLKGADGSPLPYIISEVGKDRAVIRRGRRNFILAFSNVPRAAAKVEPKPKADPDNDDKPKPETVAKADPPRPKKQGNRDSKPIDTSDPKAMILQLLSGLGGGSGGSMGSSSGLNSGALGGAVNEKSITAGLDALSGKYDNIGRGGDETP